MNAAVSSSVSPRTAVHPAIRPRKATAKVKSSTQVAIAEATIETTSKLVVSVVLGCVSIVSLGTLIPLAQVNSAKLQELSREVSATQNRVDHLQAQLNLNFDPQQARSVVQDVEYRVERQEVPIIQISEQ